MTGLHILVYPEHEQKLHHEVPWKGNLRCRRAKDVLGEKNRASHGTTAEGGHEDPQERPGQVSSVPAT